MTKEGRKIEREEREKKRGTERALLTTWFPVVTSGVMVGIGLCVGFKVGLEVGEEGGEVGREGDEVGGEEGREEGGEEGGEEGMGVGEVSYLYFTKPSGLIVF